MSQCLLFVGVTAKFNMVLMRTATSHGNSQSVKHTVCVLLLSSAVPHGTVADLACSCIRACR